jgi:maleate isomerase
MRNLTGIGMLVPSSNTFLEPATQEMVGQLGGVRVHFTRVPVVSIGLSDEENAQFETSTMVSAARLLADAGVQVIAWNGTAGSWLGLDHDRALAKAITDATAVRATTSTLAFFSAFEALGVKSYGLAVPYIEAVTQRIVDTYANEGLTCRAESHLELRDNTAIGSVGEQDVAQLLRDVAVPGVDSALAVCTNFAGTRVAATVEEETDVPVLDSVAVTLWHCLQLAGVDTAPLASWGRIFTVPLAAGR